MNKKLILCYILDVMLSILLNFANENSRTVDRLLAAHSGDSLLNESAVLDESSESMMQWLVH